MLYRVNKTVLITCNGLFFSLDLYPLDLYWTKVKALHLNLQNEASQYSKWKCIWMFENWDMHNSKVVQMLSRGKTWNPFKCDRGPVFQVTNLNRNLTQFRLSEIQYRPRPSARNATTRNVKVISQVCFDHLANQILKSGFSSNCQAWIFITKISIGISKRGCILVWGTLPFEKW